MQGKRNLRPFLIVVLCFFLQGASLGILSNCRGVFNQPVCAELGVPVGKLTAYSVFYGLAVCATVPIAAKLIKKYNLRFLLTACAAAAAGAEYAMSYFTAVYQWYIAAAIQGVSYAILVVITVPMLIHNWFSTNQATVLGISSISSGLIGALMNSLAGRIILTHGWRVGYRFLGVMLFLLLVPVCLAFAWRHPEDVGGKPFAKGGAVLPIPQIAGMTTAQAVRTPEFYILAFFACAVCCTVGYNQCLPGVADEFGFPQHWTSDLVSIAMLGTILFKIMIGRMIDAWGIRTTAFISTGGIIAGFVILSLGTIPFAMYLGSLLMGMPMAVSIVLIQAMVRRIFGSLSFETIYSYISIALNFASNFSFSMVGWIVSVAGTYQAAVYAGLGITIVALLLVAALFWILKKGGASE